MKSNKSIVLIISAFIILELVFILSKALKADYEVNITPEVGCAISKNNFKLGLHLTGINKDSLKTAFPYKVYLDSADHCDIHSLQKDIATLNSFNPGNIFQNQTVITLALTNKLSQKIEPGLKKYNPDSLLVILQWANRFNDYKDLDTTNARIYNAINSFWIGFIANQLGKYSEDDPSLKYNFKFRYIAGICQSRQYQPSIGISEPEKIILYTIDSKWPYLFQKFWVGTGITFKIIAFAGIALTLYGYICVVTILIRKIKKLIK